VSSPQPEVISYRALRRAIGILGILLPLLVTGVAWAFGDTGCQPSISAYFHTTAREVFVGVLAVVGAFLISYKGFDSADSRASNVAGVAAIAVAAFPCQSLLAGPRLGIFQLPQAWSNRVHVLAAAVLFVTLAGISAFLFTRSAPNAMTRQKKSRNVVYRTCAVIMALALLEIAASALFMTQAKQDLYRTTFLGETVALLAFGVSWLVKGETILKDD
jgi:drug/metabolite transporter (DMT)-like permease